MKERKTKLENFVRASLLGFVAMALVKLVSCDEGRNIQHPTSDIAPPPLTNVRVEPTPGGAIITYDIPNVTDIMYVYAEYVVGGETRNARVSIFRNYVVIAGLAEEIPHNFTLYLVSNSEVRSQPYRGSFTPLEPPFITVFNSLTAVPDFGGVMIDWENVTNETMGFFLLAKDDFDEWVEFDLVFSTLTTDRRAIRGYDTSERMFGTVVIDRFHNVSDTFTVVAEPLYESQINPSTFAMNFVLGDNNSITSGNVRPLSNIWNGLMGDGNIWHTDGGAGFTPPQTFTFTLGVDAYLSRMVVWDRMGGFVWGQHNMRFFEVWGTRELLYPVNDEYWRSGPWRDDWILLGDFEAVRPSGGVPGDPITPEDTAAAEAGLEHMFETGVGKIRYLRFVVRETWARTAALHVREIHIFGDDGSRYEE
jgi:hypothetical protein